MMTLAKGHFSVVVNIVKGFSSEITRPISFEFAQPPGKCVCVYSNSRNDVLRVAQRYGTIAAHTWRRASVLVVFVVFLHAYVQFCRFDKADATADVQ